MSVTVMYDCTSYVVNSGCQLCASFVLRCCLHVAEASARSICEQCVLHALLFFRGGILISLLHRQRRPCTRDENEH